MHISIGRRAGAVLAAAVASAAFGAPAANAAGLTSCGSAITDPGGDGYRFTVPRVTDLAEQAPHYDITETFFTAGDGVVKVQMKVADMKAEPDDTWWPTWQVNFTAGGTVFQANARMIDGAMTYYFWPDGASQGTETSGEVIDGPGGGVIIEIPMDAFASYSPGMAVTDAYGYTRDGQVAGATPHANSDRAPDSGTASAKVDECSAPPPQGGGTGGTNPTPPASPPPSNGSAPANEPAPAPATTAANTEPGAKPAAKKRKKASSCARKAKKIKSKAKKRKALARCKKAAKKKKARAKRS